MKNRLITAQESMMLQVRYFQHVEVMREKLDIFMRPAYNAVACQALLGFYKPHNRSPKGMAALKHSLTILTLRRLYSQKFLSMNHYLP